MPEMQCKNVKHKSSVCKREGDCIIHMTELKYETLLTVSETTTSETQSEHRVNSNMLLLIKHDFHFYSSSEIRVIYHCLKKGAWSI